MWKYTLSCKQARKKMSGVRSCNQKNEREKKQGFQEFTYRSVWRQSVSRTWPERKDPPNSSHFFFVVSRFTLWAVNRRGEEHRRFTGVWNTAKSEQLSPFLGAFKSNQTFGLCCTCLRWTLCRGRSSLRPLSSPQRCPVRFLTPLQTKRAHLKMYWAAARAG